MTRLPAAPTPNSSNKNKERIEVTIARLYIRLFPEARFKIYSMIGRLLAAEIDARSALEFVYDVLSNDGRNKGEFEAVAVEQWMKSFREHGRISEALSGWVPQTEILLLEAGELSGRFQHAFDVMLRLNERMSSIRGMILIKLAYPVLSASILGGVLYVMSTALIPQLVAMKGSAGQFTGIGGTVVSFMNWISVWLLPSVISFIVLLAITFATMSRFRGPIRVYFDKFPPWATHRFISGTGFLSAILVLMESGRGLVDALSLVGPNASPYLREKVKIVEAGIREGDGFGDALLRTGDEFPDKELIKEIKIYEHIGRLDQGLISVVEQWMTTATARSARQISLIGSIVMIATFATVGLVFTGLYDIIGQLK